MSAASESGGGVSFAGLLTIAFIVLKLTGVIAWSWLLVISPLWISAIAFVVVVLGTIGYVFLSEWWDDRRYHKGRR